ncbi:MAG TPA: MMPL family transporter [Vicinamibacterales bacterium]|nr:MMPL family transporter [Vicinamibacterales bacterium]
MSRFPARLADFLYRFRLAIASLVVVGAVGFAPSADLTKIDNDLTAWVSEDDPAYIDYERFRNEFGGTRSLIIALRGEAIFTAQGLSYIDRISSELQRVDRVERVQSLATANIVRPLAATPDDDGGVEVRPILEGRMGTDAGAVAVREEALDDPLMRGDLVSENGQVTAVVVTFDEDRIDEVRGQVLTDIRAIVERDKPAAIEAHYNGSLEISEEYNRVTIANTQNLTAPILLITLAALYWLFRSVRKTLLIALAIGVSVLWTLGLYAAMGFSLNVLTSMLTPLVVVLAIADDVHIVQHFDHELRLTGSKEHAFKSSITILFAPLLAASGTTALGMLSLATSDVVAVRTFGIGAATGVMVDFAMSLVLVPTLLTLVRPDPNPPPQERWLMQPLQAVGRFSFTHAKAVIAVVGVTTLLAAVGISRLRVDTNHINFFAEDHPLSRSAAVVDQELSGIYSFNVLLEGPADSINTPDTLRRIDQLSARLSQLPYVRKVLSVSDYVKRVNQQLAAGAAEAYRLPDTPEAIAQELFVFGLSDEGRAELSRMVSSDYSRAHIAVKLASMSSDLVFEQIQQAEQLAATAFTGTPIKPTVTGSGRIFSTLDHYLVVSQISSFATAFVTVFAVIFLVFRSARFGVLGIVANAFPVLAVLGLMGWLNISLNVATVMVASVALGIVDDDTIHFIGRYRREMKTGIGSQQAVELASMHEGRAALTTTVINALSYTVLMVSDYRPTAWFGSLLAVTMVLAFIAEVFLVPAIIALFQRHFGPAAFMPRKVA